MIAIMVRDRKELIYVDRVSLNDPANRLYGQRLHESEPILLGAYQNEEETQTAMNNIAEAIARGDHFIDLSKS